MKEEIMRRAKMLEAYAEVMEMLEDRVRWYQHTDDETGEVLDDDGTYAETNLQALRETMKAVRKLAGV